MKKEILLSTLLMMACGKKEAVAEGTQEDESGTLTEQVTVDIPGASLQNGSAAGNEKQDPEPVYQSLRVTEGNKIIKTVNGDMIPLTIKEEFTNDHQQFILKIRNFKGSKIMGMIVPENTDMNIRFNQIRLANGEYDGPFGREIRYDTMDNGEIWLVVGRSNMASGSSVGQFEIKLR